MKTRCKPGDLAVIVREEPGCEANIGKLVEVRGPIYMDQLCGPCWIIRSISTTGDWLCRTIHGPVRRISGGVRWSDGIDHPDAWLMPIRGLQSTRRRTQRRAEPELLTARHAAALAEEV